MRVFPKTLKSKTQTRNLTKNNKEVTKIQERLMQTRLGEHTEINTERYHQLVPFFSDASELMDKNRSRALFME